MVKMVADKVLALNQVKTIGSISASDVVRMIASTDRRLRGMAYCRGKHKTLTRDAGEIRYSHKDPMERRILLIIWK